MRGRLIQRFKAEIARLDTVSTAALPGYDDDFREVIADDTATGDGIGDLQRVEHAVDIVPCQIGSRSWEALQSQDLGNTPQTDLTMYLHFADLERLSLVDADGQSLIKVGARLVSIRDYLDESVVVSIRTPPGLYVVEARPAGWGLNMARPTRNLLQLQWSERSAVT